MEVALASQQITVRFGAPSTEVTACGDGWRLDVAMPVLGAEAVGQVVGEGENGWSEGRFHLVEGGGIVTGAMVRRGLSGSLEWPAYEAYRDLFRLLGNRRPLYRVWNYVPRINEETDGLENYRHFNIGRHRAFEEAFGPDFAKWIPAASALGIEDDAFALVFVAGDRAPEMVENPNQVPAYRYPGEYGPKAPAFARGAVVEIAGRRTGFLSGTSSVRGHLTVEAGDFDGQFRVTVENIRRVAESMGIGETFGAHPACEGDYRVFVRNAADVGRARALFEALPGRESRRVVYLRSDICREDLSVEIEAVFRV